MLPSTHLSLTQIFLHNWHRFHHQRIAVQDSLYLAGHNGSGKSSLLDALQVVLIADRHQIRFNSSAQDRSERNLATYVLGQLGEGYALRQGNQVAYIVLEFADAPRQKVVTLGVCIEVREGQDDRTYFILPEPFDEAVFVPNGQPRTRRELRKLLRARRGVKIHDNYGEYRADLLDALGGLNERFFDLFIKALRFEPIRNIGDFVERYLLDKKEIRLDTLQSVRDNLQILQARAEQVERQLRALTELLAGQQEALRLRSLHEQYTLLAVLLRAEAAARRVVQLIQAIAQQRELAARLQADLERVGAVLKGAKEAYQIARDRYREADVVRRREALEKEIDETTHAIGSIEQRWRELRRDLQSEAGPLQAVLGTSALEAAENTAWQAVVDTVLAVAEAPPPTALAAQLQQALPLLANAHSRLVAAQALLSQRRQGLEKREVELVREIAELEQQGQIRYRPEVERLQTLLTPIVGTRPALLCELIEVVDARWQDAVEAMLGARRFNLIVSPTWFERATQELDRARAQEKLYDVGLLDVARASAGARPAQPGSLATQVTTQAPALQAYINQVLGEIMLCETVAELRQHRRAVTPEVVVYAEWVVRAIRPNVYTPHFIGQRARASQIAARRRELAEVRQQLNDLKPQWQNQQAALQLLQRHSQWALLHLRLDAELDASSLRVTLARLQAELAALDLSGVVELAREVERLAKLIDQYSHEEKDLNRQEAVAHTTLASLQKSLPGAQSEQAEQAQEATAARERYPETVTEAEKMLAQRLQAAELDDEMRKVESAAKGFDTQANNAEKKFTVLATAYNRDFAFAGNPGNPRDERYAQERERLAATELPQFKAQIEQARQQAEHELREHVLHTLREQIREAKQELGRINNALAPLEFHHEKYAFRYEANPAVQEFYQLITGYPESGALFESQFYVEHRAAFERLHAQLTHKPADEAERREQERLVDYRHYLQYDIEIQNLYNGNRSRLSRMMNQKSGGETQTPFYLTLAASFVQLYNVHTHSGQPAIRLVVFDEAFTKMDQDRIGATLELFKEFGLQVITATPLERCEYLVPKMCTNLVLTVVKETVHIEPYHNYYARLYGPAPARA